MKKTLILVLVVAIISFAGGFFVCYKFVDKDDSNKTEEKLESKEETKKEESKDNKENDKSDSKKEDNKSDDKKKDDDKDSNEPKKFFGQMMIIK